MLTIEFKVFACHTRQRSHLKLHYREEMHWLGALGSALGSGGFATPLVACAVLKSFLVTYRGAVFKWNSLQRICFLHCVSDEDLIVPQAVAAGASVFLKGARGVAYWLFLVEHEFRVIHVGHDLLKLQKQIIYALI